MSCTRVRGAFRIGRVGGEPNNYGLFGGRRCKQGRGGLVFIDIDSGNDCWGGRNEDDWDV